jgi:signal transduction histidine kinase
LRFRYFLTISIVLSSVVATTLALNNYFISIQKLDFIDQQVRETASSLINSEIGELKVVDFDKVEEIISDELGESRIGKFFIIRNEKDEILFESQSAQLLPINEISNKSMWVTANVADRMIRVLNLKLPRIPDRTLQVGLIIESSFISPNYFSKLNLVLFSSIMFVGFVTSWLLSSFLLRPINKLARFLRATELSSNAMNELKEIPTNAFGTKITFRAKDEFAMLINRLNAMIGEINKSYKIHRIWAAQMAHEIKTPLAIINIQTEEIKSNSYKVKKKDIESISNEVSLVSQLVNSFLDWVELDKSPKDKEIHAIKAKLLVEKIGERLNLIYLNRLVIHSNQDFVIFCEPLHVESLLQNLIVNGLKYTAKNVVVEIKSPSIIIIKDSGGGLPEIVKSRMGEPFNKHYSEKSNQGHGLGLAWVYTIAKKYGWIIELESDKDGTVYKVNFIS